MVTTSKFYKVYQFKFKNGEPILVSASSYIESFEVLARSPYLLVGEDSIESISQFNNLEILA